MSDPHRTSGETALFNTKHQRRSVLRAVAGGILGASVVGSGTALGARLDNLVATGQLTQLQASELLTELYKLLASDAAGDDGFGYSVSVSADRSTALIGAYRDDTTAGNDSGSAYVFDLSGSSPTQTAKLVAADAAASDYFGSAVSISADGSTALVGARFDDTTAGNDSGSAYVFDLSGSSPTQTAKLVASDAAASDQLGFAVSISADGNTALVGAYGNGVGGSAYVFDLSGSSPTQTAKLVPSGIGWNDQFGFAVSVSADGSTALVGARGHDTTAGSNAGAAYVFDLSGSSPTQTAKLVAADAAANDQFGHAVSISADGNTALVGAILDDTTAGIDSGSAYVFDLSVSSPTQTAKLVAGDAAASDQFGSAVSISADGSTALVGAHFDDITGVNDSGSAYVFDLSGSSPTQTAKLVASDAAQGDVFGAKVSISADGSTALVGAHFNDDAGTGSGSAYVFLLDPFSEAIVLKNGKEVTPADLDGDGLYEDLDGDGDVDGEDNSMLSKLENAYRKGDVELTEAQVAALDFDGDGVFTKDDVKAYIDMYDFERDKD